ncbi:histidine--tRNA ligase, chloroplastic/mitochondrial-like [Argentina anserina]|uniref:histidine--tRNA ligase, chloroplastic/mitochondrial-like n=1 Tax=Argentina anserina TaxID=57926 RepID=UPI00217678F0|nr:histidine--tRNA ligase, chloroplastic/mitochondrial-like [Potentilla anserina]
MARVLVQYNLLTSNPENPKKRRDKISKACAQCLTLLRGSKRVTNTTPGLSIKNKIVKLAGRDQEGDAKRVLALSTPGFSCGNLRRLIMDLGINLRRKNAAGDGGRTGALAPAPITKEVQRIDVNPPKGTRDFSLVREVSRLCGFEEDFLVTARYFISIPKLAHDVLQEVLRRYSIPEALFSKVCIIIDKLLKERGLLPELGLQVENIVCALDPGVQGAAATVATILREKGQSVNLVLESKTLKWVFKRASRINANRLILVGDSDWQGGMVGVKILSTGEQLIKLDELD